MSDASPAAPNRILIVRLSALGDILHGLPVLTTLRRHFPAARIDWLVEDSGAALLEGHPALSHLEIVPRQKWAQARRSGKRWDAMRSFLRFSRHVRSLDYDLVIDLQGLAKSGFWVAMVRSPRKAGFGPGLPRNEGAWLSLTERIQPPSAEIHAVDRNLRLLECLGFPRLPVRYDLPEPEIARLTATALIEETGLRPGQPFVAVNPMSRWPTKNWSPDLFARTLDLLAAAGVATIFTGAAADRTDIDAIARCMHTPVRRLDGKTQLPVLTALYRQASILLSTDTGPMHLAVAVGTPIVAVFGPTAPWRTGPYGPGHRVLRIALPCSPCFKRQCVTTDVEPHACMRRLQPQEVADAVLESFKAHTHGADQRSLI